MKKFLTLAANDIKRRYRQLAFWIQGERYNVSFSEIIKHVLGIQDRFLVRLKRIVKISSDGENYAAHIKGLDYPLFFPKTLPLKQFWIVVGEQFMPNSWHLYEIRALPQVRISKNDIVVDCGAADGLFSLIAAQKASKVYALEPVPEFIRSMHRTFKDIKNVEIIEAAVSNKRENAFLTVDGFSSALSNSNGIPVRIETLDSLFYDRNIKIDFIKADIEGAELDMLQGAKQCLIHYQPKLALTAYHRPNDVKEMIRIISSINNNYKFYSKGIARTGGAVMLFAWV